MKVEVRYQSKYGNTQSMAEIIAKELGVKAKSVEEPMDGKVDILFVGGGVYSNVVDEKLSSFVNSLDSAKVGCVVPFRTLADKESAVKYIQGVCAGKNISIAKTNIDLRLLLQSLTIHQKDGQWPNEKQVEDIVEFARKAKKKAEAEINKR